MKAACIHFGKCSGCTLQQFPYVKQLFDKSKRIRQEFVELAKNSAHLEQTLPPIVPSPDPFGYRISSKLCLHEDDQGQIAIGLYRQKSKQVLDIAKCPVHHPAIEKLIDRLFRRKISRPAPFYNHSKKSFQLGKLKFLTLRYNLAEGNFGIVLSHTGVAREVLESWARSLAHPALSVYECLLTKADGDLVLSRNVQHLFGPELFRFDLLGLIYELDPLAFFQANGLLLPKFIEHITKDLKGDTLLDLYGGFGAYSFNLASTFRHIELVEANERALRTAEATAQRYQITHIQTFAASVEDYLKSKLKAKDLQRVQAIIVNPPRTGLSRVVVQNLCESRWKGLKQLTYVSCNWQTLKRDLRALIANGGFELESLTPFDMFPQTDHIELVAKLRKAPKTRSVVSQ